MKISFLSFFLSFISVIGFGQTELKTQFENAKEYLKHKDFKKADKEFTSILEKATELNVKKFSFIYRGLAKRD